MGVWWTERVGDEGGDEAELEVLVRAYGVRRDEVADSRVVELGRRLPPETEYCDPPVSIA